MKKRVIILGGGVAGMSAAHELVERDFAVEIYERKHVAGGKARSIPVPHTGQDGRADLPGEHGFRFFPRFYWHLPDTMKRIPYPPGKRSVFDNLVETDRIGLARDGQPTIEVPDRLPRTDREWRRWFAILGTIEPDMRFRPGELSFFVDRLWQLLTSCERRRGHEYERMGWWQYIEAEQHSLGFKRFLAEGLVRSLVAAVPQQASTLLEGDIGLQLLLNMSSPGVSADRLLNGPTNDVWIKPWRDYLTSRGVVFHFERKLVALNCSKVGTGLPSITGVQVMSTRRGDPFTTQTVEADYYILALPVEALAFVLDARVPGHPDVRVHESLFAADRSLENVITLARDVNWMNGIQFFLKRDVRIVRGHIIYLDSPWALTSVSQPQFWDDFALPNYGDGTVRGILSVDISNWFQEGFLVKKKAICCDHDEIIAEVWDQLKRNLNQPGAEVLKDEDRVYVYVDQDIVKAAKQQSLHRPHLCDDAPQSTVGPPVSHWQNIEPLFIGLADRWHLRPDTYTRIPNLFLASDYVRTYTKVATMEAANEAARRAVNGIIDAAGARVPLCKLRDLREPWMFKPWRWYDEWSYAQGLPWQAPLPWPIRLIEQVAPLVHNLFIRPAPGATTRAPARLRRVRGRTPPPSGGSGHQPGPGGAHGADGSAAGGGPSPDAPGPRHTGARTSPPG